LSQSRAAASEARAQDPWVTAVVALADSAPVALADSATVAPTQDPPVAAVADPAPEGRTDNQSVAELRLQVETEDPALAALFDRPISRDEVLEMALQRNLGLDVARRAHEVARKNIGIASGEFYPELQVVANGRRIEDASGTARRKDAEVAIVQRLPIGTALSAGVRFEDTNGDARPATGIPNVALVQPLLRGAGWDANTSGIRDAQLGAQSQAQALRAEVLRITFAVDTAYFEILRRQQLIEVNQRAVARDEELLEFSKASSRRSSPPSATCCRPKSSWRRTAAGW
jgi:outer membrane protein TolC